MAVKAADRYETIYYFQQALAPPANGSIRAQPPPFPSEILPEQPTPNPQAVPKSRRAAVVVSVSLILLVVLATGLMIAQRNAMDQRAAALRIQRQIQSERAEAERQQEEAARQAEADRQRLAAEQTRTHEQQTVAEAENLSDRVDAWLAKRSEELGANGVSVTLENACQAGPIQIAMRFKVPDNTDHWMTSGWWKVDPGQSVAPKLATTNGNIYFFAETADISWDGTGDSQAITVPVVSNRFVHVDGDEIEGASERKVTMFHRSYDTWGNHPVRFTCDNR
jgi:uncharacterized membrane protein